jgi:ERCC4-related helicase
MNRIDYPFQKKIHPEDVQELIDFNIPDVRESERYKSLKTIQTEGVAALYNILCDHDFAYLADEVGMGKTYQALGVASIVWSFYPDARIVFLCPRENLQMKWERDYKNFILNNYRRPVGNVGDDIIKSILLDRPVIQFIKCENLRHFAEALTSPGRNTYSLRHASFMRVAFFDKKQSVHANWKKFSESMVRHGLHDFETQIGTMSIEKAPQIFTERFGDAFNSLLRGLDKREKAIDLIIVDEAQYLRNHENISNTLLRQILNGQVNKWLYLSATPIHSEYRNIQTQINMYALEGSKQFITEADISDYELLQKKMKSFLIRRPRKYVVDATGTEMRKIDYRKHDLDNFAFSTPKALPTFSMALVQKHLVRILDGNNNRFKIGFLSSFESLESSLQHYLRPKKNQDKKSDFEITDPNEEEYSEDGVRQAPDDKYISTISQEFTEKFKKQLPHPKLESLVEAIWENAFLNNTKYLIFVRRISTVAQLKRLLEEKYFDVLHKRVRDVWNETLQWKGEFEEEVPLEETETDPEIEDVDVEDEKSPFRAAMAKGEWLFNFKRTFSSTGKNTLFFQENWLRFLCQISSKDLGEVIEQIPENIWAESLNYARSGREGIDKAKRYRYIIYQLLGKKSEFLTLSEEDRIKWMTFLGNIYPGVAERADVNVSRRDIKDPDLLKQEGLWDQWQSRCSRFSELSLGDPISMNENQLYEREIKKNWIGQYIRLSDTILDLYFADKKKDLVKNFFEYLTGDSIYAQVLRRRIGEWIAHYNLLLLNCFDMKDENLATFASRGSYDVLNVQSPVLGMTGATRTERGIKQFKTPGYPQIIVCTDVLKEGLDLHIFCDRVIHYGLAWTAGDMEQRVGRVDRYFSQIERRLYNNPDKENIKLDILYPFLKYSLEREQVDRVVTRQKQAELVMDRSIEMLSDKNKEVVIGRHLDKSKDNYGTKTQHLDKPPFEVGEFNDRNPIPQLSIEATERIKSKYIHYAGIMAETAKNLGIDIKGNITDFEKPIHFTIKHDEEKATEWILNWMYAPRLGCYTLKATTEIKDPDEQSIYQDRFILEKDVRASSEKYNKVIRYYLPKDSLNGDIRVEQSFGDFCAYLIHQHVKTETGDHELMSFQNILDKFDIVKKNQKVKKNSFLLDVQLDGVQSKVQIYIYRGMYLITTIVEDLDGIKSSVRNEIERRSFEYNHDLTFGYLSIHKDKLQFGVRFFHSGFNPSFLETLIRLCLDRADVYRLLFVGNGERD